MWSWELKEYLKGTGKSSFYHETKVLRIVWRIAKEYRDKNTAILSQSIEKREVLIRLAGHRSVSSKHVPRFKDNVLANFIDI